MMISVFMIAYNHEKYIRQAINGVMMQQTSFDFELIIGEDCSTDNTLTIIEEYVARYPWKIHLITSQKNVGMQQNVIRTLEACKGKYIALCEGDDYWTSPDKLQKQVDFMEANPEFTICFHDVKVIYETVNKKPFLMNQDKTRRDVFEFEDVVKRTFEIATCSCLLRNLNKPLPKELLKQDWPILLYYSFHGSIKYIDEVMGVYRRHGGGFTHHYSSDKAMYTTEMVKQCRLYFAPRNSKDFYAIEALYYADICFNNYREGNFRNFKEYYANIGEYDDYLRPPTKRALEIRRKLLRFPLLAKSFSEFANRKQRFFYLFKKKA